jgi:spermidine synthase
MMKTFQSPLAATCLVFVTVSSVFLLAAFYQQKRGRLAQAVRHLCHRWEFVPADLGGLGWFQLALASALSLFLEMLMIRWIAAEVPVFAYFKNVVLIGCFLGFGLGCCLCRRTINLLAFVFPVFVLALLVKLPWPAWKWILQQIPYYVAQASDYNFLGGPPNSAGWVVSLGAILLVVLVFALVAFVFVPLGQVIGWLIETAADGVYAYTLNVLASLAGIVFYTLLCFRDQPPAIWFALSGIMAAVLFWRLPRLRWTALAVFAVCVALVSLGPPAPARELWSPYQKITLTPMPADHPIAYLLETNDAWYQKIIDLSPQFVAAHPELFRTVPVEGNAYNLPYHFYPHPGSVLVLGAGTGNDVAAAVRNGAGSVVAVEIDPLILQLGRKLHFEHPYQNPRVTTINNDARSYIQNSSQKFDMIVFSLLDSHTTASYYSNIRIDNYVYTREAFQAARRLLKPDGILIVKFWVQTRWIAARLYGLVSFAFGQTPLDMNAMVSDYTTPGRFFIAGSQKRIEEAMSDPVVREYLIKNQKIDASRVTPTTDDWPYFYQRARAVPPSLIILSVALGLFCWRLLEKSGAHVASLRWHFFFLGAGFMLLETQIVSKMALLFGTTWIVNSLVVGGLLVLIAAANMLIHKFSYFPRSLAYAGLFFSLGVAYLVPLEGYFFPSIWVKAFCATAVLCLPALFAAIIFIRSFSDVDFEGAALGSNLFGALVGGLLEVSSQWTGIKFLVILAAILYAASLASLLAPKKVEAEVVV